MTTIQFLAEWALRSSILILCGAVLLKVARVKDASVRLAAWTALLFGSMLIPAMTIALPGIPLPLIHTAARPIVPPVTIPGNAPATEMISVALPIPQPPAERFNWERAALLLYIGVAFALLIRLWTGLILSQRLLRRSHTTGQPGMRESDCIAAPVTLGIVRPAIVLPADWREWDAARLDAVLAHERSHIRRRDPAVQLLSAIHRSLLWFSPLSWMLHARIVSTAEEASDDAAVLATGDRTAYAEILLDFIRHATPKVIAAGVPMARYGSPDKRIHRILDATSLSRGITRWSLLAIVALGSPLAYVVATAQQQTAKPAPAPLQATQPAPVTHVPAAPPSRTTHAPAPGVLTGLGNVSAITVTIHPESDGQLKSINFTEGKLVQAGDAIAEVVSRQFTDQLTEAQAKVDIDDRQAAMASDQVERGVAKKDVLDAIQANMMVDSVRLKSAREQFDAARLVRSPITGIAGLRQIEPGNNIRASDPIVTITQLQPISVIFTLPESFIPQVRAHIGPGDAPVVEIWNRDFSTRLAAGRLVALDNQIDQQTRTVKLKATFENKDSALFPNQFVNARLLLEQKTR